MTTKLSVVRAVGVVIFLWAVLTMAQVNGRPFMPWWVRLGVVLAAGVAVFLAGRDGGQGPAGGA